MQESHTSDGSVSVGISLMLPCPAYDVVGRRAIPVRRHLPHLCARWSAASRSLDYSVLQFFCTHCPCQPNATTMRTLAGAIVNPCKIPENYAKSISAQRQTDGRRAGLKIRSPQEGVGSSPTFGTEMSASRLQQSLQTRVRQRFDDSAGRGSASNAANSRRLRCDRLRRLRCDRLCFLFVTVFAA
jgi:hypothetical protein